MDRLAPLGADPLAAWPARSVARASRRRVPALSGCIGASFRAFREASKSLALADRGTAYVYYTGAVELEPRIRPTLSYLAAWDAPGESLAYRILGVVDTLDPATAPLGAHFIQVAPVVVGEHVYLYGTGDYRRSPIHLARQPLSSLGTSEGYELFDSRTQSFVRADSLAPAAKFAMPPLLETEGVGELSVQRDFGTGMLLLLYERVLYDAAGTLVDNRIVLRMAAAPEGPWSAPVTIADMADPVFQSTYCCPSATDCPFPTLLHCDRAGLYGAYVLRSRAGRAMRSPCPSWFRPGTPTTLHSSRHACVSEQDGHSARVVRGVPSEST